MKKFHLSLIVCLAVMALTTASCSCAGNKSSAAKGSENGVAAADTTTDTMTFDTTSLPDEPVFDIVTSMGTIKVKLYSKTPKHRENFIKLVKEHYYDGLIFHRVINGFMIQGGDPLTKDPSKADFYGTGGPDYTIPAEIIPDYYHKKGALAAASKGDTANPKKASSGSQFYLVQDEMACMQLDGEYTVFGETVKGLDVIDKIASVETDRSDRPLERVVILSIVLDPDQGNGEAEQESLD